MDTMQFISKFFYRIRYWLLWGSLFVTGLVVYFTQFLPYSYTVKSSLYAGVTNSTSLDGSAINYAAVNSTFDNLINIAKSQGTLEKVSIRILANALTYGQPWKDTPYILAKHYRQLEQIVPKEVKDLVDRKNAEKTVANLTAYRKEVPGNFVYAIFNRPGSFYSASTLDQIDIKRAGNSDILNITYTSPDPGMAQKTVSILIDELIKAYEVLRFKATEDVITYFKEQVRLAKTELDKQEDDLMEYSVSERVINYTEETKALAGTRYGVDDRLEQVESKYQSASSLRKMLESKMDIRAKIIKNNTNLLKELEKVSTLNQNIMEQEIFTSNKAYNENKSLKNDKLALKKAEENINQISDKLNEYSISKEGVGIQNMVNEWLTACIDEVKAKAELKVLQERQVDIFDQYSHMSPIGTQVNRKQRAIGIAEDNYRTQLNGLASASLRLKNIEMSTSNLQTITPPDFPLTDNGRKRFLYILVALAGSLVFITTFFLLIEILDRTLRDPIRSKRLTGLPVIAAFNGISNLKFRGFLRMCNRIAAGYCCRQLNKFLQPGRPTVINLLSMEPREGKSFLTKYFADYWKTEGLRVRIVRSDVDFEPHTPEYINARQLSDFWSRNDAEQEADIILVEYPAANRSSLPLEVLKKADVNLLVANACRLWRDSDEATLQPIKEALKDTPFFLYLNNADRDVVESFTGDLPPRTPIHSLFSRLSQLGLTSQKAAVK